MILKYLKRKRERQEEAMYGEHLRKLLEMYANSIKELGPPRPCDQMNLDEMLFRYQCAGCALILKGDDTQAEEIKKAIEAECDRRDQWLKAAIIAGIQV